MIPAATITMGGLRPARRAEAIDRAGTQAGEDQQAGEHHRDGVERMPEKHREALHEGDLDEEERQSEAREEKHDPPAGGWTRVRRARDAEREQRCQDQQGRGDKRLHQGRNEDHEAPFDQRQPALRTQREQLGQGRPLERVEEERPIVGRGCERELVAGRVSLRIVAKYR